MDIALVVIMRLILTMIINFVLNADNVWTGKLKNNNFCVVLHIERGWRNGKTKG